MKKYQYVNMFMISLVFSFTSPVVQLYFMGIVEPRVYAASTLITTLMGACFQTAISSESIRQIMKRWIIYLIVIDTVSYVLISLYSVDSVNFRFISMSILNGLTQVVIGTIMADIINNKMSGNALTNFRSIENSCSLWGAVVGAMAACFISVSIDIAIYIQCIGLSFSCVLDNKFLTLLYKE